MADVIDFVEFGSPRGGGYPPAVRLITTEEPASLYGHGDFELWSSILEKVTRRLKHRWSTEAHEDELRQYSVPLIESFKCAASEYPSITIDSDVMAGAPCIASTRIPVYMILDAIEYHGTLEGAIKSYPRLTLEQVKDAIGFAKLVVECPVDNETTYPSR